MLKKFFNKPKYVTVSPISPAAKQQEAQGDSEKIWAKCIECGDIIYNKELEKNLKVCPKCNYHFRMNAKDRVLYFTDEGSFQSFNDQIVGGNPLEFPGYEEKLKREQEKTGLKEAILTGTANICGNPCIFVVIDPNFFMGSMGMVVGEKLVLAIEQAVARKLPLIVFSASGGARMQEGILSLMQMAKTSAALNKLSEEGLLFISVCTDPTTGGVTASFASLGDIIIAEPKALIGFAGPRVIEQTIRQKLPTGFQRAEFLLEHGLLDMVVHRNELKSTLAKLLALHS
ncbi:MAG: acetyl-CoA carboxylase, carboxyltransferase subunit beta [Bacillota bacterium]|nr:acetyl-CoA carboxylase, carboxyltransferase subunit beta [Bacillota bacterium]